MEPEQHRDRSLTYRGDIDALRALAVVAVVLFHLHVPGFAGGYIGVDVFFVISGYLITSLIFHDLDRKSFSLRRFYLRRVRRLAPALLAMIIPVTCLAYWVLYPEDMRSFAASLAAQFLYLQNIVFLNEGEYFRNADTKLLLHTWTLAVEEQFYLLWPLFLLFINRCRPRRRMLAVIWLMSGSFALNLVLMRLSPKASFFLLPSRAWELGMGGLIALVQREGWFDGLFAPKERLAIRYSGLLLIAGSVTGFTSNTPFPGFAAILPVTGAAGVIVAGMESRNTGQKVGLPPVVVHIGLLSYSIYLWHWPVIAFAYQLGFDPRRHWVATIIVIVTLLLSETAYRFVEMPVRTKRVLPTTRQLLVTVGLLGIALTSFGASAYFTEGAAYRFSPKARALLTAPLRAAEGRCGFVFRVLHPATQVCPLYAETTAKRRILLWGNSHADMWSPMLVDMARKYRASIYLNARNCRATRDHSFCNDDIQRQIFGLISSEGITDVVLASTWFGSYSIPDETFKSELARVVGRLSSMKVRTWLVVDTPSGAQLDPVAAVKRSPKSPEFGEVSLAEYLPQQERELKLFESLAQSWRDVKVIEPFTVLCDQKGCPGGKDGVAWYRDSGHLTNAGAQAASAVFFELFGL